MKFYHVKDWGGCDLSIDFSKVDLLPRFTLSQMMGCFFLNIGFLMLTFNLCIYDSATREFVHKMVPGELKQEVEEKMNNLRGEVEKRKNDDEGAEQ